MPEGLLLTVPEPVLATLSVLRTPQVKVAVTLCAWVMLTTHVPVPEQPAPLQPAKVLPESGLAASVTLLVLLVNEALHALPREPQLMPSGLLMTVPEPLPLVVT